MSRLAGFYHREDASNILTNDPIGPDFTYGPKHMRPEVTVIFRALSLSGDGEGLAGETSCKNVDPSPSSSKIRSCNIRIAFCMAKPVV